MAGAAASHFLMTNFGLTDANIHDLSAVLARFSGFIAGGSALYWHMGEVSPADQDLDIWLPTKLVQNPERESPMRAIAADPDRAEECYEYTSNMKAAMTELLTSFGYNNTPVGSLRHSAENGSGVGPNRFYLHDIPYHTNPEFQKIVRSIADFVHLETHRKIQVIYYYADADPISGFDLDICKIQARPVAGDFELILPAGLSVAAREMRITNTSYPPNLRRRVRKYRDRGFVLVSQNGERMSAEDVDAELMALR